MPDYLPAIDADSGKVEVLAVMLFDQAGLPLAAIGSVPATTLVDRSLTVTVTVANAMPANTARRGWKIKNDTAVDVWIRFTGTAVAAAGAGSIRVSAGGYLASEPTFVETGAMSVITTTTAAVTIYEFT